MKSMIQGAFLLASLMSISLTPLSAQGLKALAIEAGPRFHSLKGVQAPPVDGYPEDLNWGYFTDTESLAGRYRASLKARFEWDSAVFLETGITYSPNIGERYEITVECAQPTHPLVPYSIWTRRSFDHIKVPLLLNYQRNKDAFSFRIFAGPRLAYLTGYEAKLLDEGGLHEDCPEPDVRWGARSDYSSLSLEGALGIGLGYRFHEHWEGALVAQGGHGITGLEKKSSDRWENDRHALRLVTGSVELSLLYRFDP